MGKGGGGGGGGGGAIAPPDPFETSMQQLAFNQQAALDSARMNQVNQLSPFARTYWTGQPGSANRTQRTEFHPAIQSIIFGGGGGGGFGLGGGGWGMDQPGTGDFGLAGLPPPTGPTDHPPMPGTEETPDRGGGRGHDGNDFGRGIWAGGRGDPNVAQYDSLGDFWNALQYGMKTGDWSKPYSGAPGHGRVGGYSGPDADIARMAAKHTLGDFHPVMNPQPKPKPKVAPKVTVSSGSKKSTSAPTSKKGTSLTAGINRGQGTSKSTSAPTSSKGTSLSAGINRGQGGRSGGSSRGGPASGTSGGVGDRGGPAGGRSGGGFGGGGNRGGGGR